MIVVTGGGGFLGGAVVRALVARGEQVRSVQRSDAPALRELGVEVARADLAVAEQLRGVFEGATAVFHVAAKAGVWGSHFSFHLANVVGTQNVLDACREHRVPRLIYTSTPSVVSDAGDVEGVDESAPIPTRFPHAYAQTKAQAEALVLAANGPELATVSLRPKLIWGPNDTQLTAKVISRAKQGRLRLVGAGTKLTDSTYIDNAVDAHLLAWERLAVGAPCAGKAYFVTNGEPVPQAELINGMLAAAGLPPCRSSLSPKIAYVVGAICEGIWSALRLRQEPPLTRFVAQQLATAHWYRIDAARRDLGYSPRVSIQEGLRRLTEHLRA